MMNCFIQTDLSEPGLKVPQDISITGFDDIEIARLAEPDLTTVHVTHWEMDRRAASMLIQMVKQREVTASVKLPTDIRLLCSLGPAP
jgi:LacI family transcriptional regulator